MEATDQIRDWVEARRALLSEAGTEPPCPFCGVPRVKRSDYIRCNREGINWLNGENISKDPRIERYQIMLDTLRSTLGKKAPTVQTAESTSDAA